MNKNHIKQSGVVPYFIDKGVKKIILITAKNSKKNWIVPKGHIEMGMSPQLSAANEAFEEAGIKGEVDSKVVGTLCYSKKGKKCKVDFYPFKVLEILDSKLGLSLKTKPFLSPGWCWLVVGREGRRRPELRRSSY